MTELIKIHIFTNDSYLKNNSIIAPSEKFSVILLIKEAATIVDPGVDMKVLFNVFLFLICPASFADVSHFSLSTQTLEIPRVVVDDSIYYEDIEIELNTLNEQFTLISLNEVDAFDDPDSAAHYSSQTQILSIPFTALDGKNFYDDVEIILNQGTGIFQIISAFETGIPTQTFVFRLKLGESAKLFNADTLVYTDRGEDSRCPALITCIIQPGFVQAGLQMPISAPETTFFTPPLEGIGGDEPTSITVNSKYRLRMLESNPYPSIAVNRNPIEHSIVVEFQFVGTEL